MGKIAESLSVKCSEEYKVRFWHTNSEGFRAQNSVSLFSSSKSSHNEVRKYFDKHLKGKFSKCEVISVVYQ